MAQIADFSLSEIVPLGEPLPAQVSVSASTMRLWQAFMTARVMIALVLVTLLGFQLVLVSESNRLPFVFAAVYAVIALGTRLYSKPMQSAASFGPQWFATIGMDIVVFAGLQFLHSGNINYTPLFALPVLFAAVLGSLILALATAAAATLFLLAQAWWLVQASGADLSGGFLQAGLTGSGLFILAFLANQLAMRLDRQERLARRSQQAARAQTQVNQLVIDTLSDGVLVVNANGLVRAANPAARAMLGGREPSREAPFVLAAVAAWQPLAHMVAMAFTGAVPAAQDVVISHADSGMLRLRVRLQITRTPSEISNEEDHLCVVFMEDLREMEAKLRTEKLVSLGRMSAAVAHEIRNPLAAIVQANALLGEEQQSASQTQLSTMITQNAQRLARIVDDVLDVSRLQQSQVHSDEQLELNSVVREIVSDWMAQHAAHTSVEILADSQPLKVFFTPAHLRQILVNLLDNARRYASMQTRSISVSTQLLPQQQVQLVVWSDGAPIEQGVQRHLFEPFFSSESRSSGLGLYICRGLCERYDASIGYQRSHRNAGQTQSTETVDGNAFYIVLRQADDPLVFSNTLG